MKLILLSLAVVSAATVCCNATLESVVRNAEQMERLQMILDRIMSPPVRHHRPHYRSHYPRRGYNHFAAYTGPSVYPAPPPMMQYPTPYSPRPQGNKKPLAINVNMKINPPADAKGAFHMGGVSVFQKDSDRDVTGDMEAHWHTEKKEVIMNANTNITRIRSSNDEGEIKKTLGSERSAKIRKFLAGKIEGKKAIKSVYSRSHHKKKHAHSYKKINEDQNKANETKPEEKRVLTSGEQKISELVKLYTSGQNTKPASIPSIEDTASGSIRRKRFGDKPVAA